jgi:hypothetical protein
VFGFEASETCRLVAEREPRRQVFGEGQEVREVSLAARHADPCTTTIYDRRRQNFDRHAAYVVVAFVAGG